MKGDTMNDDLEQWRVRLRKRLAVVADYGWPYQVRIAAIKSVQSMLDADNPLRRESADDLLERVLRPWAKRTYLVAGRGVERQVTRPPVSLRNLWQ
jgi:hypothetical protein